MISREIGWSNQNNLTFGIIQQVNKIQKDVCCNCNITTTTTSSSSTTTTSSSSTTTSTSSSTTTTTTTSPPVGCDCRPGQLPSAFWNYFDCTGVNRICTGGPCKDIINPCFDINKPYSGIEINTEAGWICECSTTTTTTTSPA